MTRALALLLVLPAVAAADDVRFRAVDLFVEIDEGGLAVWQLEVVAEGDARIVGVEGGDAPELGEAPYYDPAALHGGRIVLAAFTTGGALPPGRHRVARLHVREAGPPVTYVVRPMVVADGNGDPVSASTFAQPKEMEP